MTQKLREKGEMMERGELEGKLEAKETVPEEAHSASAMSGNTTDVEAFGLEAAAKEGTTRIRTQLDLEERTIGHRKILGKVQNREGVSTVAEKGYTTFLQ